jgi:hypothetical protein
MRLFSVMIGFMLVVIAATIGGVVAAAIAANPAPLVTRQGAQIEQPALPIDICVAAVRGFGVGGFVGFAFVCCGQIVLGLIVFIRRRRV